MTLLRLWGEKTAQYVQSNDNLQIVLYRVRRAQAKIIEEDIGRKVEQDSPLEGGMPWEGVGSVGEEACHIGAWEDKVLDREACKGDHRKKAAALRNPLPLLWAAQREEEGQVAEPCQREEAEQS